MAIRNVVLVVLASAAAGACESQPAPPARPVEAARTDRPADKTPVPVQPDEIMRSLSAQVQGTAAPSAACAALAGHKFESTTVSEQGLGPHGPVPGHSKIAFDATPVFHYAHSDVTEAFGYHCAGDQILPDRGTSTMTLLPDGTLRRDSEIFRPIN